MWTIRRREGWRSVFSASPRRIFCCVRYATLDQREWIVVGRNAGSVSVFQFERGVSRLQDRDVSIGARALARRLRIEVSAMNDLSDDKRNLLRYYAETERIIHEPVLRCRSSAPAPQRRHLREGRSIAEARWLWRSRPVRIAFRRSRS